MTAGGDLSIPTVRRRAHRQEFDQNIDVDGEEFRFVRLTPVDMGVLLTPPKNGWPCRIACVVPSILDMPSKVRSAPSSPPVWA
jgi:hypothetical protein